MRFSQTATRKMHLVAVLVCSMANAQSPSATVEIYVDPKNPPDCQSNELALSKCESRRAEHSGKYLKALVEKVSKALPLPDRVPAFQKSNEAWVAFRNASCDFDSEGAFGSSRAYRYVACTHSYNKARIALLEKYLSCLKGECSNDVQLYYLVSPP
jgi:uncharacterized protein YecT (DUF1311 family)